MVILYHGTSSCFVRDIIKNGLGVSKIGGKYAEIRTILSKYINPNILTDEFFDKYSRFIRCFTRMDLRETQSKEGVGPFGVIEDKSSPNGARYRAAPGYAKTTTKSGAGEFEREIISFLNSIQQRLDGLEKTDNDSTEYKDFLNLLKNYAKPEYIKPDGNLNFYTSGNYETDFPILIKIEVPDSEIALYRTDDARTKKTIKPEQIVGIAFLPPFDYGEFFDNPVPDLNFLSKEEFLKELNKREGKHHWNESFEIKKLDGSTRYMFLFPTNNIACVQQFGSDGIYMSDFFARKGHINRGKIAEKSYKHGKPYECKFYNNWKLTAKVMFKSGKPAECSFFDGRGNLLGKDEFFIGKDGKYHLIATGSNKLTKQQMFILNYEKQPQKMSDKVKTAFIEEKKEEIKSRLKDVTSILARGVESRKKAQSVFNTHKSSEKVE